MVFVEKTTKKTTNIDKYQKLTKFLWKHIFKPYRHLSKHNQQQKSCLEQQKIEKLCH